MPCFTMKLMKISSNIRKVHFLLNTSEDRERILVFKFGVDLYLIISSPTPYLHQLHILL